MGTTRGEWLARQMERRGRTVRQIAEALDVTPQTVYGWQNNKTVINEERVPRLAEALGITEIEARAGLGFWVPAAGEPGERTRPEDLETIERLLEQAMAELARLKEEREIS